MRKKKVSNDVGSNDFEEEEPTPRWSESMAEIMASLAGEELELVRSPGIPTPTSDRPTRPMIISRLEEG